MKIFRHWAVVIGCAVLLRGLCCAEPAVQNPGPGKDKAARPPISNPSTATTTKALMPKKTEMETVRLPAYRPPPGISPKVSIGGPATTARQHTAAPASVGGSTLPSVKTNPALSGTAVKQKF